MSLVSASGHKSPFGQCQSNHTERKVHWTKEGLVQGEGSELQEKPADSENNHASATDCGVSGLLFVARSHP